MANTISTTIRGQKISLHERQDSKSKAYTLLYNLTDQNGQKMPRKSKTFKIGANSINNTNDLFHAAYDFLKKQQDKVNKGDVLNADRITLREFLDKKWAVSVGQTASNDRYLTTLHNKRIDELMNMRLKSINLEVLERVFKKIASEPSPDTGKLLAVSSVKNYQKALSNVFNKAVAYKYIPVNPILALKLNEILSRATKNREIERKTAHRDNRDAFTEKEYRIIRQALVELPNEQFRRAFTLEMATGLRTEEIIALEINHSYDFRDNYLLIDQAGTNVKGKGAQLKGPKTTPRKVYFNEDVANLIREQEAYTLNHLTRRLGKNKVAHLKHIWLFGHDDNVMYRSNTMSKIWNEFLQPLADQGVRQLSFYSMRHTYISYLANVAAMPLSAIAAQSGNSVGTIIKYYLHPFLIQQKELANVTIF